MQRGRGVGEQLPARDQIEAVVGVAPVRGAPPHGHQPAATQLAQVVRRQALPLADQRRELTDLPIAARQLAQQPPPQRVSRQPQKPRR